MASEYYRPCKELDICNELIEKYWESKQYDKCFEGHLVLAEQGYPLAECQIGYFYYEGLGVEKDLEKALYWTRRAAEHGDRDRLPCGGVSNGVNAVVPISRLADLPPAHHPRQSDNSLQPAHASDPCVHP